MLSVSELYWLDVFGCSSEKHLERSVRIYRIALERSKQCVTSNMAAVTRHLAAALNEYGVSLMQKAEKSIDEGKHCRASIEFESNVKSDARRAFIEATNILKAKLRFTLPVIFFSSFNSFQC